MSHFTQFFLFLTKCSWVSSKSTWAAFKARDVPLSVPFHVFVDLGWVLSIRIRDFWTPGFGIVFSRIPDPRSRIPEHESPIRVSESYVSDSFWVKSIMILCHLAQIQKEFFSSILWNLLLQKKVLVPVPIRPQILFPVLFCCCWNRDPGWIKSGPCIRYLYILLCLKVGNGSLINHDQPFLLKRRHCPPI
jgi:hypothetical protein